MFDHIADQLLQSGHRFVTTQQYQEFEDQWVFYRLGDYRYGQAFCEHFDLDSSTPLYKFRDTEIAKRWIADNYLDKNETRTV